MSDKKRVTIVPLFAGTEKPGGAERIHKAADELESAKGYVAGCLWRLIRYHSHAIRTLEDLARKEGDDELLDLLEDAKMSVETMANTQETFFNALAGRD